MGRPSHCGEGRREGRSGAGGSGSALRKAEHRGRREKVHAAAGQRAVAEAVQVREEVHLVAEALLKTDYEKAGTQRNGERTWPYGVPIPSALSGVLVAPGRKDALFSGVAPLRLGKRSELQGKECWGKRPLTVLRRPVALQLLVLLPEPICPKSVCLA